MALTHWYQACLVGNHPPREEENNKSFKVQITMFCSQMTRHADNSKGVMLPLNRLNPECTVKGGSCISQGVGQCQEILTMHLAYPIR